MRGFILHSSFNNPCATPPPARHYTLIRPYQYTLIRPYQNQFWPLYLTRQLSNKNTEYNKRTKRKVTVSKCDLQAVTWFQNQEFQNQDLAKFNPFSALLMYPGTSLPILMGRACSQEYGRKIGIKSVNY